MPDSAQTEKGKGSFSFRALIEALRIEQWVKNGFLLAPLALTPELWTPGNWMRVLGAFLAFSLAAGAMYLWNDWCDLEADREHPKKSRRALASGRLQPGTALGVAALLVAVSGLMGAQLGKQFSLILVFYIALQLAYSLLLKRLVILDVMAIAAGFVLRVLGGGYAVGIPLSSWFLITSSFLALFLGFTKRRQEIRQLGDASVRHRTVLAEYNINFIDQMNAVLAGGCIVCYALFTVAPETVEKFGTQALVATLPFVVYGVLRYLHLVHVRGEGDNPTEVLWRDRPIQISIVLWLMVFLLIVRGKP